MTTKRALDFLRQYPHWVCWKYEPDEKGKLTKVPKNPATGGNAMSNNPTTWGTLEQASAAKERLSFDGIGFMLKHDIVPLVAFDLDECIERGELSAVAKEIVNTVPTYTEITPSGQGLRLFALGDLPPGQRKNAKLKIECYKSGRFLTVTGNHLPGTPETIERRDPEIVEAHRHFWANGSKPSANGCMSQPLTLDDTELLDKARRAANGDKFTRLFDRGDTSEYGGDNSSADLALCNLLAFWTGGDASQIDRLFRQSKLYRSKWNKLHNGNGESYGQMTINKALVQITEFYSPASHRAAKDNNLMSGVTKSAAFILGLAPSLSLPDIDQAAKLSDLEHFINMASVIQNPAKAPRIVARNRKLAISFVVCQLLARSGRLLLDIGDDNRVGIPYVIGDDRSTWPLSSELMPVRVMLAESGLNPSELTFQWLLGDLEKATLKGAPRVELARFWTQKDGALYISAGPCKMVKATMAGLAFLDNGSDGIFFASDATLPEWNISTQPIDPLTLAVFNPPLVAPPVAENYTPDIQRLLLRAWLVALVAGIRPLPLLVATGNSDGGKTTLIKAILKLLLDNQPTTPSDDARDLWTLAVQFPAIGLDNLDADPPAWLSDFLAALVTGVSYDRRKFHTNVGLERRNAKAAALISTRTAMCVSRPDVAQRTLPLLTGIFQNGERQADNDLNAEIENNRDACLTWLATEAVKMLSNIKNAPKLADIRFIDFARVAWAFDSQQVNRAIQALQQAQSQVVGETDELLSAIIEHIDDLGKSDSGKWEGTPKQLISGLTAAGASISWQGGGKAIAAKLRESRGTLALFGISLDERPYGHGSIFSLWKF